MSDQDLFEKDYLAAHPEDAGKQCLFCKLPSGAHIYTRVEGAFGIWLQQAKRHEAEIGLIKLAKQQIDARLTSCEQSLANAFDECEQLRAKAEARAVPHCYELTSKDPQADEFDHEMRLMFVYDMEEADGIEIDDYKVVPLYTAPPEQAVPVAVVDSEWESFGCRWLYGEMPVDGAMLYTTPPAQAMSVPENRLAALLHEVADGCLERAGATKDVKICGEWLHAESVIRNALAEFKAASC